MGQPEDYIIEDEHKIKQTYNYDTTGRRSRKCITSIKKRDAWWLLLLD
jgi:hypothetical protein